MLPVCIWWYTDEGHMFVHPVCLCLSCTHKPMTLTATEELPPEYKDAICEGELKQTLICFFGGGLHCSDFTMASDFMVSSLIPPSAPEAW